MIFCSTRNSASANARQLAEIWNELGPGNRRWDPPKRPIRVEDQDLMGSVIGSTAETGSNDRQDVFRQLWPSITAA